MATWGEFEAAEPDLAARVRGLFDAHKHKTLATLRSDGSPRISGIEVQFEDGQLTVGMMLGSRKAADLERDPRLALHSPTVDAPEADPASWRGDAKVAGRAVEMGRVSEPEGRRFRVDLLEVVLTRLNEAADQLVIESWHPGRGYRSRQRR